MSELEPPPTVEEIVGALLERRRPDIARIVHERVEALVGELVELELNGRTNGAEAKTCRLCGQSKGLAAFDPGRLVCRACRNDQAAERERRRRGDEAPDPLAAGGTLTTSPEDSPAT